MPSRKTYVPSLSRRSPHRTATEQAQIFAEANDPLIVIKDLDYEQMTIDGLADVLNRAHEAFEGALFSALQAALIAGKVALIAQDRLKGDRSSGGFRAWIDTLLVSRRSIYRYITLAEHEPLICGAKNLSEAYEIIRGHNGNQKILDAEDNAHALIKQRVTLRLHSEQSRQLKAIAEARGIAMGAIVEEAVQKYLEGE